MNMKSIKDNAAWGRMRTNAHTHIPQRTKKASETKYWTLNPGGGAVSSQELSSKGTQKSLHEMAITILKLSHGEDVAVLVNDETCWRTNNADVYKNTESQYSQ